MQTRAAAKTAFFSQVLGDANLLPAILGLLDCPADRRRSSLVCRAWHRAEGASRRSLVLSINFSGGAADSLRLLRRFPHVERLEFDRECPAEPMLMAEICIRLPALRELRVRHPLALFIDCGGLSLHCALVRWVNLNAL